MDPSFSITHSLLGRVYLAKELYQEGLAEAEKYAELNRGSPLAPMLLAYAHARSGERSQALQLLEELGALSKQRYVSSYYFAVVYAGLGDGPSLRVARKGLRRTLWSSPSP